MALGSSCKFYDNSKCTLEGKFCDLDCSRLLEQIESRLGEKVDPFIQWQRELEEKEIESTRKSK
jgi:hypothetical protein